MSTKQKQAMIEAVSYNITKIMVRVVTEGEYQPWYTRRACPVFCYPCVPAYMGVWKASRRESLSSLLVVR
ncbi:hypothetical protein NECAME_07655 [Necator americanus]|uniref:Uncharacterized protein n=1 Tax=Necator americanus TaxID=51031 RepID=W2TP79_NECAM|nr:hypothetical protein NECAME_07655 [Necator americanus]ETN82941.1 hypothetical protein NECAME_07655 [Necator americanus]